MSELHINSETTDPSDNTAPISPAAVLRALEAQGHYGVVSAMEIRNTENSNSLVVRIKFDGSVEYGEGITPDEASRRFFEATADRVKQAMQTQVNAILPGCGTIDQALKVIEDAKEFCALVALMEVDEIEIKAEGDAGTRILKDRDRLMNYFHRHYGLAQQRRMERGTATIQPDDLEENDDRT